MIMPRKHVLYPEVDEQLQKARTCRERNVEVLVRLVWPFEEERDVLEHSHAPHSIFPGLLQLGLQPLLLLSCFFGGIFRMLDEARVQHNAEKIARSKGVVVASEAFAVPRQRRRCRLIADVV